MRTRRTGGSPAQPWSTACRAAATAASTSGLSPSATGAKTCPRAGSMASSVAPDRDQVRCPSINIRPSTAPRAVRLVSATSLAYLCQGAIIWVNQICIAVGTAEELIGMRTVATYLTGRRNLAGSGLALLAGALVLVDPVGLQGIVLVIGFYWPGHWRCAAIPKSTG